MSLLVDPDYAIHALRLAYLRRIDDHAGPRVITLPSISHLNVRSGSSSGRDADSGLVDSFADVAEEDTRSSSPSGGRAAMGGAMSSSSGLSPLPTNSHVFIAGLNDARYQPELATLYSPKLNSFLAPRQDSRVVDLFGGLTGSSRQGAQHDSGAGRGNQLAGLNYTTTILGPGRSGALGMRVSGRRAMSGDVPRRGNGAAMSDSVVAEEHMERPLDGPIDGEQNRVGVTVPGTSEEVHIPHGAEQPERRSQRSSSLRMPTDEARLPSSASSAASYRNRSSSQPHHVAASYALKSDDGTYDDESVFSDESQSASRSATDMYPGHPKSSVTPPSRPPRRVHRSEEPHKLISQPRAHNNDGSLSDVLSTTMATHVGSPVMPFRRRSASEGAAEFLRDDVRQQKSADVSGMERGEDAQVRSGSASLFNRLNSNSTLFSLASPPMNQGPSLANRWPRSEGGSAQSLAKLSPAPGRIMPRPGDSITSSRSRTDDPSPYLRKAVLSASMENSSGIENESAHPSDGSSAPLNNSGDMSSSVRDQELLRPSSAGQLINPGDIIDESLDESAAASSNSLAAPIISALGLQMAWSDKEPLAQPLQPSEPTGKKEGSKSATSDGPTQHGGLDAHQKQQWFSSLRTDAQTVARRFESRPQKSGISAMLSKHSQGPSNPFASLYKGVAGGSVSGGSNISVEVYFPFASHYQSEHGAQVPHAKNKSMPLSVRKTATMEEVIGYSLYCYVEEGCHPLLDENLSRHANEEEREVRLSTLGWTLRIVEDGEVDDDYPAIDRSLTVGNFGADELAVCEATAAQVKQHQSAAHFTRRKVSQPKQAVQTYQSTHGTQSTAVLDPSLSSTLHAIAPTGPSARLAATAGNIPAGSLVHFGGTPIFASSALSKSVMGPSTTSIFLRVLITPNSEVKYKTTLQVPSDMYLADVLETICRKRQLANVDQWALVVPEKDVVVPLDRTVESLQGNHDLALVKRQELGDQAGAGALTGQSTNPNASIFKRLSEPVQVSRYNAAKEIASTYKSYTVNRKQASFLGRHERILTIDGDWLHIIPTDARAFQTQSGTSSFPITAILSCTQSRLPSSFKLIVARENDQKRYEFEAESSKVSAEIVEEINSLMKRTK